MFVIKCPNCGITTKIAKSSPCPGCSTFLDVTAKPQSAVSKGQKIVLSLIIVLVVLGLAGYYGSQYIAEQQEKARIEAEQKQFESFDMISFNPDNESVQNALKSLPVKYNSPQPPSSELIMQNVETLESKKKESETTISHERSTFSTPGPPDVRCYNSTPIGRVGPAVMTTGGCITYQTPSTQSSIVFSTENTTLTTYSLKELKLTQFDYVKGRDNKLFCFASFNAIREINRQTQKKPLGADKSLPSRNNKATAGQYNINETALFEFVNGNWQLIKAGLKEIDKMKEINQIRIDAINNTLQKASTN